MSGARLTPLAASLPASVPFVGPETQERAMGAVFRARIGANESTFGPSPRAVEAMARAAPEAWKYPDSESYDLRSALAAHFGVGMGNIVMGAGIDGLLGSVVRLTVTQGDHVVTSLGAYPTFNYHVHGYGGTIHKVPYRNDREDPEALIAKAYETGAKLVYLSNPDNPMGTWHDAETITRMIEALPDGCLLILDEAYIEFAPEGTAPPIDVDDPRVIRMRTFSKAYGLAGARMGYAVGNAELIAAFSRVRNHFGLSRVSQAGALAALEDRDYLADVVAKVATSREHIARIGAEHGFTALPSATNFVALDLQGDGDRTRALLAALNDLRIFVRMPGVAPLDRCLRISCGTERDMALFTEALPEAMNKAGITGLT